MSTSSLSAILYAATVSTPSIPGPRPDDETTKSKAHHTKDGIFDNPWPSWKPMTGPQIAKAMLGRRWSGTANIPDTTPPTVPTQTPVFLQSRNPPNAKLRATWLGHACYYVEFPSGLRVLFDPVFEDRCSPFSWLGPKRYTKMPCEVKDIPFIDAVIISHNHYDHLSHPTVSEIAKRHPDCHFFIPLGNKKWFAGIGIKNCTELDWWDEVDFTLTPTTRTSTSSEKPKSKSSNRASVTSTSSDPTAPLSTTNPSSTSPTITARISSLPCQHTSARTPFDRAHTLWSSWSVTSGTLNPSSSPPNSSPKPASLYFAGDTGYRSVPLALELSPNDHAADPSLPHCPAFADVGRHRGPFALGLIPIGAYRPRYVMSPIHADPRDAVRIFEDTRCEKALGMHWGTWVLTEEDVLEPPRRLKEALKERGIEEEGKFDVLDIGASREV